MGLFLKCWKKSEYFSWTCVLRWQHQRTMFCLESLWSIWWSQYISTFGMSTRGTNWVKCDLHKSHASLQNFTMRHTICHALLKSTKRGQKDICYKKLTQSKGKYHQVQHKQEIINYYVADKIREIISNTLQILKGICRPFCEGYAHYYKCWTLCYPILGNMWWTVIGVLSQNMPLSSYGSITEFTSTFKLELKNILSQALPNMWYQIKQRLAMQWGNQNDYLVLH